VHSGWLLCQLLSRCHLSSTCASSSHCTAASHRAPLVPLVRLVVVLPLVTPPSPVRLCLRLSSHRHLLSHPSYASCPAGCPVTSCHAAASRQPASPPVIVPLVWLVVACHAAPSASHCTATSHHAPLAPLIWLVVASPLIMPLLPVRLRRCLSAHGCLIPRPSHNKRRESLTPVIRLVVALPLIMPPPLVRLHLCLSSHRCLSSCPSCASCPADCHVASPHAAASCPPAPPTLIAPPPLTTPLLCLLSGRLFCHFSLRHHLLSACTTASHHTPLVPIVRLAVT
jgi:hypothetical protein